MRERRTTFEEALKGFGALVGGAGLFFMALGWLVKVTNVVFAVAVWMIGGFLVMPAYDLARKWRQRGSEGP